MPTNIVVPELGESVVEATVARWLKKEGDRVAVGEPVVELETEKVNLEVGAEKAGVLVRIERKEGEDVRIGQVLGVIEEAPVEAKAVAEKPEAAPSEAEIAVKTAEKEAEEPKSAEPERAVEAPSKPAEIATPSARRLAREYGIDIARARTGATARVTKEDIQSYVERQKVEREAVPEAPAAVEYRRQERIRMSRRRRTIARRMLEAQQTAAMLTTFNEIDMGAVMELRKRHKESFKQRHGVSLGITSFFVKAVIGALKEFPQLNAEIQGDEIVLKYYYDIGIAVGAQEGLVVPVLRDADRMSFAQIEKAIKGFAEKAEEGRLTLEDLRGGTFTITNGGVFGSLLSTPMLNPPQVGILGLHNIEERPVVRNGEVVIRPMMYVALTYDHRIVDGREAVRFLVRVKELIESPEALLLES